MVIIIITAAFIFGTDCRLYDSHLLSPDCRLYDSHLLSPEEWVMIEAYQVIDRQCYRFN